MESVGVAKPLHSRVQSRLHREMSALVGFIPIYISPTMSSEEIKESQRHSEGLQGEQGSERRATESAKHWPMNCPMSKVSRSRSSSSLEEGA